MTLAFKMTGTWLALTRTTWLAKPPRELHYNHYTNEMENHI